MKRIILLLALAVLAFEAAAQNSEIIQTCQSLSGASRTRSADCASPETDDEPVEKELTLTLEVPVLDLAQCQANLSLEYLQIGSTASVDGVIHNDDCAASSGEYTITARIRTEDGETKTLEFPESWQRDDDQPVTFTSEYPIGENVQLLRLRSRGLRCTCTEPAEE